MLNHMNGFSAMRTNKKRFGLLFAALLAAWSGGARAADFSETSDATLSPPTGVKNAPTNNIQFDYKGLVLTGNSTNVVDGMLTLATTDDVTDQPVIQVMDLSDGSGIELNAAQKSISIYDAATSKTSTVNTTASDLSGTLTVEQSIQVNGTVNGDLFTPNINSTTGAVGGGQNAMEITGSSLLNGALRVTGATALNVGGANQIIADDDSARLVSGSNNVTVNASSVGLNYDNGVGGVGKITSSITMQGVGTPGVVINASGSQTSGAEAQVTMTNTTTGRAHGLFVRANETVLTGGTASTELTLSDAGMLITDSTNNNTFAVSNAAAVTIGNNALAGSLSISNGSGGNAVSLNGVTNTIVGTTSTAITGGTTTMTVDNSGMTLNNKQIHGVADGVADTDAVNVRQLTTVSGQIGALTQRVDQLEDRAFAGIASVAALSAIPAPPPGKRFTVGAGVGTYASKNALAIGFRGAVADNVSVTLGVSHNSESKTAANAGVGFSW